MKKMDGEGFIKNGLVISMFSVFYFEPCFVLKLKVPEMRQTMLTVLTTKKSMR